jgi:hypothetical protein
MLAHGAHAAELGLLCALREPHSSGHNGTIAVHVGVPREQLTYCRTYAWPILRLMEFVVEDMQTQNDRTGSL